MISKTKFVVRLLVAYCLVTTFFVSLPFISSGYVYNLDDIIRTFPGTLSIALVLTLLYELCAYTRRESRDGWIVADSSSRIDTSTP
ncbi:MAG: hypothetical protein ACW98Y_16235 [Candidatus Thorarchaeota archaeon]